MDWGQQVRGRRESRGRVGWGGASNIGRVEGQGDGLGRAGKGEKGVKGGWGCR